MTDACRETAPSRLGRSRALGLAALFCIPSILFACGTRVAYSPPAPAGADEALVLALPFDDAWGAVIQTFFQRNIPIKTLEKASGIVESDELQGEIGRDCDCGKYLGVSVGGYGAYGGDAQYRFRVLVQKRSDRETSLVLRSSCRAHVESIEGELNCRLIPAKEAELRTAISQQAGPKAAAAPAAPAP